VDKYIKIRKAVMKDGMSKREAARIFGVSRPFVETALQHSVPQGYHRKVIPPSKLDPFKGIIDQIIIDDKKVHKKQKHTAIRIFERLRDEEGFTGSYTIVKDYIKTKKRNNKEAFVPIHHSPGDAQVDFGEADIYLNGKLERCHYFTMTLPYSNAMFIKAYPLERTESFLDGHISAFKFFGKVPNCILYDNASIMVKSIEEDKTRNVTDAFKGMISHYLFEYKFANIASGNEKGSVEGDVGFGRRKLMVPIPRTSCYDLLNNTFADQCLRLMDRQVRGKKAIVKIMLEDDLKAMSDLPKYSLDPSTKTSGKVNSTLLVRFDTNDYSAPFEYAHHDVSIKAYWDIIEIYHRDELIAKHNRLFDKEEISYNPMHYLKLLERKPGALNQADPLWNWDLPKVFKTFKRKIESRLKKGGQLEFIQTLRLLEVYSITELEIAIEEALRLQTISMDAVKLLVASLREKLIPNLDLEEYPHIPNIQVHKTKASDYMCLLRGSAA
jgi:transposase